MVQISHYERRGTRTRQPRSYTCGSARAAASATEDDQLHPSRPFCEHNEMAFSIVSQKPVKLGIIFCFKFSRERKAFEAKI